MSDVLRFVRAELRSRPGRAEAARAFGAAIACCWLGIAIVGAVVGVAS